MIAVDSAQMSYPINRDHEDRTMGGAG